MRWKKLSIEDKGTECGSSAGCNGILQVVCAVFI